MWHLTRVVINVTFVSPFLSLSVTSEFCNLSSFESIRMPGRRRGGRADKAQFRNWANPKQIERTIQMQMQTFKHKSKTHTNLRMSKNCQIYEWRGKGRWSAIQEQSKFEIKNENANTKHLKVKNGQIYINTNIHPYKTYMEKENICIGCIFF